MAVGACVTFSGLATVVADLAFQGSVPHEATWRGSRTGGKHVKTDLIARCGLVLVAAATLVVTGCGNTATSTPGSTNPAGVAAPAPAKDAATALAEAVARTNEDSYKMAMDIGELGEMSGSTDPVKKQSEFTMSFTQEGTTISYEFRLLGTDSYMKMDAEGEEIPGLDGKTWYHRDITKSPTGPSSMGSFDAAQITATLQQATDVKRVGDKDFTGMLDLSKAAATLGMSEGDVKALPTKSIPFKAAVDDQDRLVQFTFDTPPSGGEPAQTMDMRLSDFGTPVDVQAPPADQVEESPIG